MVAVPVNTMLKSGDYEYMLNDSRARAVIVSEALLPQLQAIPRERLRRYLHHIIVVGNAPAGTYSFANLVASANPGLEAEPTSPDDAAFWLYSSGSTGFPKGCVHLHHDIVVASELYGKGILGVTERDRCFSVAKLFFAYGLGNGLYFPAVGRSNEHPVAGPADASDCLRCDRAPSPDIVLFGSDELRGIAGPQARRR
jgi:4-hydroxybenzoate-CoA ligase